MRENLLAAEPPLMCPAESEGLLVDRTRLKVRGRAGDGQAGAVGVWSGCGVTVGLQMEMADAQWVQSKCAGNEWVQTDGAGMRLDAAAHTDLWLSFNQRGGGLGDSTGLQQ